LTRDPVAELTALGGYPYEVIDTAGEGPVPSRTDEMALLAGRGRREGALLVLLVDGAIGPSAVDRELVERATLVVANKSDLSAAPWPEDVACDLRISCVVDGPAAVRERMAGLLRQRRSLPRAGPVGGPAALAPEDGARLPRLDAPGA
jgi:tRNA U34 5-carboxymethylaminomethyl modifying GTPase MnmE/TrmE